MSLAETPSRNHAMSQVNIRRAPCAGRASPLYTRSGGGIIWLRAAFSPLVCCIIINALNFF